jgi:large subunit ribosomal protein L23
MREPYDILLRPVVGDKAAIKREKENRYAFVVVPDANKIEIKRAIEQAFKVKVLKVNTACFRGKKRTVRMKVGYTPRWKKAVVTLAPGQHIALFESA